MSGHLEHLGCHDDMARVGFENCRDYRDAMIDEGDLSSGSILNHLKLLKALFTYAFDNEHITTNPMARIKYSVRDRKERDDFTPEERKLILIKARKAEPHVYWITGFAPSLERELQRWPTPTPSTSSVSMGSGS